MTFNAFESFSVTLNVFCNCWFEARTYNRHSYFDQIPPHSAFKETHVKTPPKVCHFDRLKDKIRIITNRKNPIHSTLGEFNCKSGIPDNPSYFSMNLP